MPTPRWPYPAVLVLTAVMLGVSGAPAPLYGIYAEQWGFAPITTTVVFAVYAAAALSSVLVTGAISDRYGRRPVLLVAIVLVLVGLVVFALADGVVALVVARALHGWGVGAVVVAGSAALLDLRPDAGARAGLHSGVAFNLGIAVTVLLVSLDAELGPAPLVTPYVVLAVLTLLGAVAVLAMREPHTQDRAVRLNVARPRVPAAIRPDFRFSALGVMAAWSVLGVFLSLFPTIAAHAVGTTNLAFGGSVVAISAGVAALSQAVGARFAARSAAVVGDLGTAASLLLCIGAVALGDPVVLLATSAVLGVFFGLAFGASLRHLGQVVPAGHRGEVMSAFYVLAYTAMVVPTLLAGWAATVWGAEDVLAPFLVLVAVACTAAGLLGLRVRGVAPDEPVDAPGAHGSADGTATERPVRAG
ncbi:MFS transporter [Nocardioides zeae]|uniref:MFS transporter n=1 Tax=Nocardioides imazamoxiresistens TaxID=3231893 RepID=A0ABU3PW70_9ACTN|nr:MFS transporter [Nocardioides zeae]MDT9593468.1 MFS transporter [Nocardioides zeae]